LQAPTSSLLLPSKPAPGSQKRSSQLRGINTRQAAQLLYPEGAVGELVGSEVLPLFPSAPRIDRQACSALSLGTFVKTGTDFGKGN